MPVFTQGPLGQQCVGSIHIVTSAGHCAWTSVEHGFEEGTFMFRKGKKGDAKSFFSFFYSLFNYFPLFSFFSILVIHFFLPFLMVIHF